jgi:hypothetical protein
MYHEMKAKGWKTKVASRPTVDVHTPMMMDNLQCRVFKKKWTTKQNLEENCVFKYIMKEHIKNIKRKRQLKNGPYL